MLGWFGVSRRSRGLKKESRNCHWKRQRWFHPYGRLNFENRTSTYKSWRFALRAFVAALKNGKSRNRRQVISKTARDGFIHEESNFETMAAFRSIYQSAQRCVFGRLLGFSAVFWRCARIQSVGFQHTVLILW
jgi:hypothetical protein